MIASVVSSDQEKYSEAFLGRNNSDYTRWILTKDAWGGAIEVQILSEYFQVEIVVVDTMSGSFTRFGESNNFPTRMVLIYDGIHYDALARAFSTSSPVERDVTRFEVGSPAFTAAQSAAMELVHRLHRERAFTDTAGFTLRCGTCGEGVRGEAEAQAHALRTGHTNFREYK